jgi:hypothetical protein
MAFANVTKVGRDTEVVRGEPASEPAEAGDDLVEHGVGAVLVAQPAQACRYWA